MVLTQQYKMYSNSWYLVRINFIYIIRIRVQHFVNSDPDPALTSTQKLSFLLDDDRGPDSFYFLSDPDLTTTQKTYKKFFFPLFPLISLQLMIKSLIRFIFFGSGEIIRIQFQHQWRWLLNRWECYVGQSCSTCSHHCRVD